MQEAHGGMRICGSFAQILFYLFRGGHPEAAGVIR